MPLDQLGFRCVCHSNLVTLQKINNMQKIFIIGNVVVYVIQI